MNAFLLHVYGVFFRPAAVLPLISKRNHWWQAGFLVWLMMTLNILSQAGEWKIHWANTLPLLFIGWGGLFLFWLAVTVTIHFTADLFGGQGQVLDTMTAMGFASAPYLLLPSVMALPNLLGDFGFSVRILLWLAIHFWSLVLTIQGVKAVQKFGLDQAIGSVLIGFIFMFAFVGMAVVLSGLGLSFFLGQLS